MGGSFLRVPGGDYALLALAPARAPRSVFALHATPGPRPPRSTLAPTHSRRRRTRGAGVRRQGSSRRSRQRTRAGGARRRCRSRRDAVAAAFERGDGESHRRAHGSTSAATDSAGRFRLRGLPTEAGDPRGAPPRLAAGGGRRARGRAGERAAIAPRCIEGEIREKGSRAFVPAMPSTWSARKGRRPERIERPRSGLLGPRSATRAVGIKVNAARLCVHRTSGAGASRRLTP